MDGNMDQNYHSQALNGPLEYTSNSSMIVSSREDVTSGDPGKRRYRTNFSDCQSAVLERAFQRSHYPDGAAKRQIALSLAIPQDRLTVWFQNRRAKWRRKEQQRQNNKRRKKKSGQLKMNRFSVPLEHFQQSSQQQHPINSWHTVPAFYDDQSHLSQFTRLNQANDSNNSSCYYR